MEDVRRLVQRLNDDELDAALASAKLGDHTAIDLRLARVAERGDVNENDSTTRLINSPSPAGRAWRRARLLR
jgi:hypothetical protein